MNAMNQRAPDYGLVSNYFLDYVILVDVSDISNFFLLGKGEGGVRGAGRGRGSMFM